METSVQVLRTNLTFHKAKNQPTLGFGECMQAKEHWFTKSSGMPKISCVVERE